MKEPEPKPDFRSLLDQLEPKVVVDVAQRAPDLLMLRLMGLSRQQQSETSAAPLSNSIIQDKPVKPSRQPSGSHTSSGESENAGAPVRSKLFRFWPKRLRLRRISQARPDDQPQSIAASVVQPANRTLSPNPEPPVLPARDRILPGEILPNHTLLPPTLGRDQQPSDHLAYRHDQAQPEVIAAATPSNPLTSPDTLHENFSARTASQSEVIATFREHWDRRRREGDPGT